MIGLGLPFALGILLITFSVDVTMLLFGRFLYGLSTGAFGLLVPSYTSETAEPRIKGAMGSLLNVAVVLGNLFVAILGKYLHWRTMTGVFLFIPVLMSVWMFFMPESPVQLVRKGKAVLPKLNISNIFKSLEILGAFIVPSHFPLGFLQHWKGICCPTKPVIFTRIKVQCGQRAGRHSATGPGKSAGRFCRSSKFGYEERISSADPDIHHVDVPAAVLWHHSYPSLCRPAV